ncbi:MAG: PHP domain-containing protein [Firmicutes bacterium]|nr:PHP domain-containing protein [Bacillota bacterium]
MIADLHVHSSKSNCASPNMNLEAIITSAVNRGLEGIGLTDHLHPFTQKSIFTKTQRELEQLDALSLAIWLGVEADVLTLEGAIVGEPGLDIPVDYVLAGVHHFHLPWVERPDNEEPLNDALYKAHRQVMGAIRNPLVNALAHPWSGVAKYAKLAGFCYDYVKLEWLEEESEEARKAHKALEIPTWALFDKDGAISESFLSAIVRPLIQFGCPLYIGTDAHEPNRVGAKVKETLDVLLSEGATMEQFWLPPVGTK